MHALAMTWLAFFLAMLPLVDASASRALERSYGSNTPSAGHQQGCRVGEEADAKVECPASYDHYPDPDKRKPSNHSAKPLFSLFDEDLSGKTPPLQAVFRALDGLGEKKPEFEDPRRLNSGACANTDDGAVDVNGNTCQVGGYQYPQPLCGGWFDTMTFRASVMCCACGGGRRFANAPTATDSGGDSCAWYQMRTNLCGCCDDDDFMAANCAECAGVGPGMGPPPPPTSVAEELLRCPAKTTAIRRVGYGIYGQIPADLPARFPNVKVLDLAMNQLQGTIPPSLWELPSLEILSLERNQLQGGLTEDVGNATRLKYVSLATNGLQGSIPLAVGAWQNIKFISMMQNYFTGPMPSSCGSWTQLQHINLGQNRLGGPMPSCVGSWAAVNHVSLIHNLIEGFIPAEVGGWGSLQMVKLSTNRFYGPLPDAVRNWRYVQEVHLNQNYMQGPIPSAVGDWLYVRAVFFDQNRFQGPIPIEVGNWTQVMAVQLSQNWLSGPIPSAVGAWMGVRMVNLATNGLVGPIPDAVGNWAFVQEVRIAQNGLSGPIPAAVGAWRNVVVLNASFNLLSGPIPDAVRSWTKVQQVFIGNNQLSGPIPDAVSEWRDLSVLWANDNALSGPLPDAVRSWTKVQTVRLNYNQISGPIPEAVGSWRSVKAVLLNSNNMVGPLPDFLRNWTVVEEVSLSRNNFEGSIPDCVGAWHNVQIFWMSETLISGAIPDAARNWTQLRELALSRSFLTGPLPDAIGAWANLEKIWLYGNQITGPIPDAVGNWTRVQEVHLYDNQMSGPIPDAVGAWHVVSKVRVSNNQFSGSIPDVVGNWRQVLEVKLEKNLLTGIIPDTVGNWHSVTSVDLKSNLLSGPIPDVVGNWTQVREVYITNNRLTGNIPDAVGAWRNAWKIFMDTNQLTGPIPDAVRSWTQVEEVYFQLNLLDGPIPDAVGSWGKLQKMSFNYNRFSGTLPDSLRGWTEVREVDFAGNPISGTIPDAVAAWGNVEKMTMFYCNLSGAIPDAVGNWTKVTEVDFSRNRLSGTIPEAIFGSSSGRRLAGGFAGWQAARKVGLGFNRFSGNLPNLSMLSDLIELTLEDNALSGIVALPPGLQVLSISGNNFTQLPEAVFNMPELRTLNVQHNQITSWPPAGVLPTTAFVNGLWECGKVPALSRFVWPKLQILDASYNPMGRTGQGFAFVGDSIRVFIHSVLYLHQLSSLVCKGCQLSGVIPRGRRAGIGDDMPHTGGADCVGLPTSTSGLTSLKVLNLAENKITHVYAAPTTSLLFVDFSDNDLQVLEQSWYNEAVSALSIVQVRIFNNLRLRAQVLPPTSRCPPGGATSLSADPFSYKPETDRGYEYTDLCPGIMTRYTVDRELNIGALCRCLPGCQGQGISCSGCPANTYSVGLGQYGLVRQCHACPQLAYTVGENATDVTQCVCPAGRYLHQPMNNTAGGTSNYTCQQCEQWPFRATAAAGAVAEKECVCNATYTGLKAIGATCGCEDGYHMNHASLTCERCLQSEKCQWGAELADSLVPPAVKPGFWVEPFNDDISKFTKNTIWRCVSDGTCTEDGCATGRGGRACSLCLPGHFGSTDDECAPCPQPPDVQRWVLAMGVLALTPVPLFLHSLLSMSSDDRGLFLALRGFRVSVKQMIKQVQTITVISGLNVDWPPFAKRVFEQIGRFTKHMPSVTAAACLQPETSASLEMSVKWGMPVAFVFITVLAVPVSWVVSFLLRRCKKSVCVKVLPVEPEALAMGPWDLIRVLMFAGVLFYSTLLQISLEMITCIPSPNGVFTVATYPHLVCGSSDSEFIALALIAVTAFVVFVGGLFCAVSAAYYNSVRTMAATDLQERGWFSFLFEDFRDINIVWTLKLMAKEAGLVLVAVVLPGQGALQLLITSAILISLVVFLSGSSPFQDHSNTLMEAWNGALAAGLCLYSAGMGFQSEPGTDDITELFQDGASDPAYRGRDIGLVIVQGLTFFVPFSIVTWQMMCVFNCTLRCLPQRLRPATSEQREEWSKQFLEKVNADDMAAIISEFDDEDFRIFRLLFEGSTATIFHKCTDTPPKSLLRSLIAKQSKAKVKDMKDVVPEEPASKQAEGAVKDEADGSPPDNCEGENRMGASKDGVQSEGDDAKVFMNTVKGDI